ncbi:MAG: glycerol-3-phosphate 1-O-acyltransferase PlsY [Clostridiales bacterium]|nr:glycerol-3-phosphate 1-O-acyltransferase PlsY [Clostridiales bacterium]
MIAKCIIVGVTTFLISYLIGSFSPAFTIGKLFKNIDIREYGSGNPGSTNVLRVLGAKPALITFLLDALKGFLATLLGRLFFGRVLIGTEYEEIFMSISAVGVVFGHNFPFYLKFKGGKGIATTFGVILYMSPIIAIILLVFEWIVTLLSRYVSLASVLSCVILPFMTIVYDAILNVDLTIRQIFYQRWYVWCAITILSILGVERHSKNIIRLINDEENKFYLFKSLKIKVPRQPKESQNKSEDTHNVKQ